MLVIARCDRTVDTSCLCKWKVRVTYATVVAHFAELIVVFSIETYNRCLSIWNSVILLINWQKNFVPSNSVSNHTQDKQIGLRMIIDWIRLHSEKFAVRWEKHIFPLGEVRKETKHISAYFLITTVPIFWWSCRLKIALHPLRRQIQM